MEKLPAAELIKLMLDQAAKMLSNNEVVSRALERQEEILELLRERNDQATREQAERDRMDEIGQFARLGRIQAEERERDILQLKVKQLETERDERKQQDEVAAKALLTAVFGTCEQKAEEYAGSRSASNWEMMLQSIRNNQSFCVVDGDLDKVRGIHVSINWPQAQ